MGILRRVLSVGVGLAAGAFAYKLLKDYNDENHLEAEYVELPLDEEQPEAQPEPEQPTQTKSAEPAPQACQQENHSVWPTRPDQGPNVNPVTLGAAEKPLTADGKLDPTKIATAEDFGDWDDMGCQG